ncbi:MAG: penicillin-binding transpeptidase domain-containing protein, partial [Pseudomonadota bacterium]
ELTLERALATSSNVAAVRLFNELGSERVIRTARTLGVKSPLAEGDPSLALGTSSMTLLELTAAYAGIAANEYPVRPHAFLQAEETWWDWLTSPEDSLSTRTHEDLEQMLRAAINSGTGRAATLPIANYGKTGTTQNYRDAVFVGYAEDLVVGVWVGNDDNSPMGNVTGGGLPARVWKDFMNGALSLKPAPKPTASPDPQGPLQRFDIEEGAEIPLDDEGSQLRFDPEGVTITTEIDGANVEFRLDEDGLAVDGIETRR